MRGPTSLLARVAVSLAGACAGLAAGATNAGEEASACGGFVGGHVVPAIAVERVLLAFDDRRGTEDFVREVRFAGAGEPFGFIVPTPGQPEVAKVDDPPFNGLASRFGFSKYDQPALSAYGRATFGLGGLGTIGHGSGQGFGSGHGARGGVSVLSTQQIGVFKAFVLRATDEDALAAWLHQNGFHATASTTTWLAHYVALGFYFTAFRYDGAKDKRDGGVQSEVVRLSFPTPVPYYPYLEPKHEPGDQAKRDERLLELWFVARAAAHPVALHEDETGQLQYKQPWEEGARALVPRKEVEAAVDPLRLPDADTFVVQAFRDHKVSRQGFGDVLLAPDAPAELSVEARAAREPLVATLLPEVAR